MCAEANFRKLGRRRFSWLILVGAFGCRQRQVTTESSSPDGSIVATVHEIGRGIDRNFQIRISRGVTEKIVYRSPDEGRPIGTERFVWTRDSRYLLLVGMQFYTDGETKLATGEDLYLLYDTQTGSIKCNASQANLPRFGIEDIRHLGFELELRSAKVAGDD